ncbi:MAG TPA: SagB/ThcOx family dehydrogenase [Candidatus Dormibacteraeota bacterium]|nr:SagB/ThcOx family dehydrogenase [Candidatus Dormibacteraeota bacterium]
MSDENRDTSVARSFHAATKYVWLGDESRGRWFAMGTPPDVEAPIWEQDWSLEPLPFKIYETVPRVAIPRELPPSPIPALQAIANTGSDSVSKAFPDRATLAQIGLLTNGLLGRQFKRRGATAEFRTAGATGARYHLELYFVCAELPDLPAGIYHYAAHDHSLGRLRPGDYRAAVAAAAGGEPAVERSPVVLAVTSTFWRNAWRYKARAYRHAFWDAGTAFANVLAVAAASGLPAKLVLGYADGPVNALLGVDGRDEAAVALCAIGQADRPAPPPPEAPPLALPTRPVSPRQVEFPHIQMLHRASGLSSGAQAASWRAEPLRRPPADPAGELVALRPVPDKELAKMSIDELILRRRSTRNYDADVPIPFDAFSSLLEVSSRGVAADCLPAGSPPLHDLYLIVNNVDGLAPGVYMHHRHLGAIELLKKGDFRQVAQRLAVGQAYAADAHVNCYYLTALGPVLERYGNRGYRLAQLECSLYAGKLHLATHALGLRAVGSTSLDDEVTEFFMPHAAGKSYMFVTVFGRRRRRA